jgi:hypothetical protein
MVQFQARNPFTTGKHRRAVGGYFFPLSLRRRHKHCESGPGHSNSNLLVVILKSNGNTSKGPDGGTIYHSRWELANFDGPPPRPGVTRVTINEGSWLLEPIGNQTRAAYTLYTDGGGISAWDRLGKLGLPIYVSEFDVNIANDDAQLRRYKALFPVIWQSPAVAGVTLWGYKQYHTWRRNAYLLRADGSERPALVWLREYVRR